MARRNKFTRYQKLATERNWCIYVLRGMMGLLVVFKRFGVKPSAIKRLDDALNSFYWTIEATYLSEKDALDKKIAAEEKQDEAVRASANVVPFERRQAARKLKQMNARV